MKQFTIQCFLLLLFALRANTGIAQTGDTDAANPNAAQAASTTVKNTFDGIIIEYDFSKRQFNQLLPFDRAVTIKIINLPAGNAFDYIRLEVLNLSKAHRPKHLKNLKDSITIENLFSGGGNPKLVVSQKDWSFIDDKTVAVAAFPFYLRPNVDYFFRFKFAGKRKLTAKEKTNVKNHLANNQAVENAVTNFVGNSLKEGGGLNDTQTLVDAITSTIGREIQEYNSDFRLTQIDQSEEAQIARLTASAEAELLPTNLTEDLKDLDNDLKLLASKENDRSKKSALTDVRQQVVDLQEALNRIDWGEFGTNTSSYQDLTRQLDTLKAREPIASEAALKNKTENVQNSLDAFIKKRDELIQTTTEALLDVYLGNAVSINSLNSTYSGDIVANARLQITGDVGAAYGFGIDEIITYSGVNIYIRPVNKVIPLSRYNTFYDYISANTSFLIGVTIKSIEKDNLRKGIVGNQGLVLGGGFRFTPWLRLNGGGLLYYTYPKNPLLGRDKLRTSASPFVSLSIDLDVQELVAGLGAAIFK